MLCDAVAAIGQKHVLDYIWLTTEILSDVLKKSPCSFLIAPYLLMCGEVALYHAGLNGVCPFW